MPEATQLNLNLGTEANPNYVLHDLTDTRLNGLATCSTAATTAAKTVSLSGFVLRTNSRISVRFANAIDVAGATLNINGTGAKAIKIDGNALQPGIVKTGMTVTLVYDGSSYNIVSMLGMEQSQSPSDLWVDMGLPSGLKWATRNIDVTQANGFAASPYQYECTFFSWGNTNGQNPSSTSAFANTWGTGNDTEPYVSSPGAALTANMSPSMDAARANLGAPWRMPTTEEYAELFANIDYLDASGNVISASTTNKLITYNGVVGIRLKSKINSKELFFPCSGYGYGASWLGRGSLGFYWSSSLYSSAIGRGLSFDSGGVYPQLNYDRFRGFAVRAVQ